MTLSAPKPNRYYQKMRIISSIFLFTLLLTSLVLAQESDKLEEMKEYETYGSRLAHARYQLLARKTGLEEKQRWYKLSGYGLHSDLYGGFHSPIRRRRRGQLELYTGQAAVKGSVATGSIRATGDSDQKRELDISQVTPVTVRSHPWDEMLRDVEPGPPLSDLFKLAPEDCLAVFFHKGSTIGDLESALNSLVEGANVFFNFDQSLSATEQIAKRLGVQNFRELEPLMGETLFISEDLDFYPGTHYALVFKGPSLSIGANLFVEAQAKGRVGDAFVLSTSQGLLDKIRATHEGEHLSLSAAQDLQYCNAVLERKRDGFCYLSESFITKLVSPAYRINSARRLAAMEGLVERQYAVLAYQTLTDSWPKDFAQMVSQGYLPGHPDDDQYAIQEDGQVEHKVWGTLRNLGILSDVPLGLVSSSERDEYEDFRQSYDRLWTRFFDPVGVAFEVKEQLRFHTIILPLINTREYNWLQLTSGGDSLEFRSLQNLIPNPISMHMKLNVDEFLLMLGNGFRPLEDGDSRPKAKEKMNRDIRKELGLDASFDLFSIAGDEFCISYGEDFRWSGFDKLDLVLSLELEDVQGFQTLMKALGKDSGSKREEKSKDGIEWVELSAGGDSKLYAIYHENFVHITIYEPAFSRLCDRLRKSEEEPFTTFDSSWIGGQHNILVRADLRGSETFLDNSSRPGRSWSENRQLKDAVGYHIDLMLLEQSLGAEEAGKFFRHPPGRVFGLPLDSKDGEVRIGEVPVEQIDLYASRKLLTNRERESPADKVSLQEISEKYREQRVEAMKLFEQTSVSLNFTPEGLSTRVSINNPSYGESRFLPSPRLKKTRKDGSAVSLVSWPWLACSLR